MPSAGLAEVHQLTQWQWVPAESAVDDHPKDGERRRLFQDMPRPRDIEAGALPRLVKVWPACPVEALEPFGGSGGT